MTNINVINYEECPQLKYGVIVMRAQPLHVQHLRLLLEAKAKCEKLIVIIGSVNIAPDIKNPFTFTQRSKMIENSLIEAGANPKDFLIYGAEDDPYEDDIWFSQVFDFIADAADLSSSKDPNGDLSKIKVFGHYKDSSSYYLKKFDPMQFVEMGKEVDLDATQIREILFDYEDLKDVHYSSKVLLDKVHKLKELVPNQVFLWLYNSFMVTERYKILCEEWKCWKEEQEAFKAYPYRDHLNVVCADPVVIAARKVLLIVRKDCPGKGLFALPGGHVQEDEYVLEGTFRELDEETNIDCPLKVLNGSIIHTDYFDNPKRHIGVRKITFATLFQLMDKVPPKVTPADDALEAHWVDLSYLDNMKDKLFEDHYHIIKNMVKHLDRKTVSFNKYQG